MESQIPQTEAGGSAAMRAWYQASIADFVATPATHVANTVLANCSFAVLQTQREAWVAEAEFLAVVLRGLSGRILFEFCIPRMGRRIDVVLLIGPVVFAVEFKVGEESFDRAAIDQVWDYALDLKNFHEASHGVTVVPLLVATKAETDAPSAIQYDTDGVARPITIGCGGLRPSIELVLRQAAGGAIEPNGWVSASYHPTPTIVEAARSLYANHSVEAIARYDAGAKNLRETSRRLDEVVDDAMANSRKVICFVTGVPGAGKTLVGLNVATRHRRELHEPTHAVFLSGNAPLVAVLREALARDEVARRKMAGEKVRKGLVAESVKAFIQNVHHFRDEGLREAKPPIEHVVIFDEAQRAWNLHQTVGFMRRTKGQAHFNQSEPEYLISYLDRHVEWAVIVCLVGGGQEINTGEAGIDAWIDAVQTAFPHWEMIISHRLTDSEYAAGQSLERARACARASFDDSLHLAVSMRSFRAENVSAFVKALLDCDRESARDQLERFRDRFPIFLTRDVAQAKLWVRRQARGSERYGLVASSKAQRLKPLAIDIRVSADPVQWFLNDREDTRSSYYLEDAATEFQVQGLELDWTCVVWDGDFRFTQDGWSFHDFRGSRWCNIGKAEKKRYLKNAYRVLLTRARQGMVIVVPFGDPADATRLPNYYQATFEYLESLGIPKLDT